jgi:DegV family protein with EDD domain
MKPTCIVTDSSAQFTKPSFPGQALVKVVPLRVRLEGQWTEVDSSQPFDLPQFADDALSPLVQAPTPEQFYEQFALLSQSYENIIAIFGSNQLVPCYENALKAAHTLQGRSKITLIVSLTLSAGLGYLVQLAAECASRGMQAFEIERLVRSVLPSTYAVICPVGLSYLYYNGFVDQGQALVNEMLGLFPIFSIENGKLIPLEKVKNSRNVVGFFQEFLDEFEQLSQISFMQSALPSFQENKILRDNYQRESPTPYSENVINLPLAALFGPRTLGMVIVESQNSRKK